MKIIGLSMLLMLALSACTPRVGVGIGGVAVSGNEAAASELYADSETGVHGSVSMGTAIRL
jgi:predicted secreted hydrolase